MKKTLLALGLLLLFAAAAFGQDVVIDYLEGVVERSVGSSWKPLDIGDRVSPTAVIRLSDNAFLELSQGALRVSVSQDGVYKVSDLISKSRQVAGWDLKNVVSGKIKTALTGSGSGEVTQAGVRAEKANQPAQVTWAEGGETKEIVNKGTKLLEQGKYAEALNVFEDGYSNAYVEDQQVFLYYIAQTHVLAGQAGRALAALRGVDPDPRTDVFKDLVLLEGQLLVESLAFQDALKLFDKQLVQYPSGSFAQALLIMSAYAYRGQGDTARAREVLLRARDMDSTSQLGREASSLLQGL